MLLAEQPRVGSNWVGEKLSGEEFLGQCRFLCAFGIPLSLGCRESANFVGVWLGVSKLGSGHFANLWLRDFFGWDPFG